MALGLLSPTTARPATSTAGISNEIQAFSPDASTERNLSNAELERRWKEFRTRYTRKDEQAAELADSDLIRLWETRNSGEEFANLCEDLESRGCSIEFSSEEPAVEVSDEEVLWQRYQDVKSGEADRRRARRAVEDKLEERLAYWREAAKRGEPLPRDLEGRI